MPDITSQLQTLFADRLKEHEPLAKHVQFRIGGPARWLVDVRTVRELQEAIGVADAAGVPWFVMGGGSNTLPSDEGFSGLVLKLAMRQHRIEGTAVTAEAGVISVALARATVEAGLQGFEWAISLPGTIGGAVRGNAGCFGGEMKDVVESATLLRKGAIVEVPAAELRFGYRESALKCSRDIVLSASLRLSVTSDPAALKTKMEGILAKRKASQPLQPGSAGCAFKNYDVRDTDEFERLARDADVPEAMRASGRLAAGWIVEQLDLKGTRIGGAKISREHGNFILNTGTATASDIVQLIALVKTRARNRFGITLEEEVQYVGF
ncbi:UDP-N-acetylmuramate dehydrogenase [Candidatus Uhrbacteria bacterium]|nr:UDP-N-acetylmuramate dehydrogenase [Candidatus Uhrbacteria bacterium]MBI4598933.1 UDP-N-acetylmuramate dehydrogenase [Candidatus Uhrbacteria bacterium]